MAKQIANVNTSTYTFQNWVDATNESLTALSTSVLTATPNNSLLATDGTAPLFANGTSRVGYSHVNGFFSADNLIAVSALRGGNTTSSANLAVTSNTIFSGTIVSSSANVTLTGANTVVTSTNTTFGGGIFNINSNTILNANVTLTGAILSVAGNTAFDTNVLFVDATNNRVGIGTATPNAPLQVSGAANVSGIVTVSNNIVASGNVTAINVTATANVIAAVLSGTSVSTNTINLNTSAEFSVQSNADIGSNTTSPQTVYTFAIASYNTAKLITQVKNGTNYQSSEMLVVGDTSNAALTVYATLNIGASANLGSFSVTSNSTVVSVQLTQTIANSSIKIASTLIKV